MDFRQTAIRNFSRHGIPEQIGMMVAGHKMNSSYRRYNIVTESAIDSTACESGGIGRRAGLRIQSRKGWEFESPLSHFPSLQGSQSMICRRMMTQRA